MALDFPAGGVNWDALMKTLQNWVVAASGLPATSVFYGQQDKAPRPPAPAIELRISNVAEANTSWTEEEDNPFTFTTVTIASVDVPSSTATTASPHGLLTGDGPVQVTATVAIPGGLPGGPATSSDVWAIAPSPTTLRFAATYQDTGGGQGSSNPITSIALSSAGSGTITVTASPNGALRAGQEQVVLTRAMLDVTLELHAYTLAGTGSQMASALLQTVRSRRKRPSLQALLRLGPAGDGVGGNVGLLYVEHVRAILGIKDAVLFEPRALCYVHFSVPSEEGEFQTVIETAEVTGTVDGMVLPAQTLVAGSGT